MWHIEINMSSHTTLFICCTEFDLQGDQEKFKPLHLKVFFTQKRK